MVLSPEMQFDTVFFGGGTPSLLSGEDLIFLLGEIRKMAQLLPNAEITVEANPGTVSKEKLKKLRSAGVNRLSLGAQAGEDRFLKILGRIHSVREIEESVEMARAAGFTDLNLDLIFGLPGQTAGEWERTLKWAVSMNPEHLSCYGLQVEEGTPLAALVKEGSLLLPDEEETETMYIMAVERLTANGWRQYEISNFARENHRCRHNLHYWRYHDYLGIGSSAHSFILGERRANEKDPHKYISRLQKGEEPVVSRELISRNQGMAEMIMLGFRLSEGPDPYDFHRRWGVSLESVLEPAAGKMIKEGFLEYTQDRYRLTRRGMLVSNRVLSELLAPLF